MYNVQCTLYSVHCIVLHTVAGSAILGRKKLQWLHISESEPIHIQNITDILHHSRNTNKNNNLVCNAKLGTRQIVGSCNKQSTKNTYAKLPTVPTVKTYSIAVFFSYALVILLKCNEPVILLKCDALSFFSNAMHLSFFSNAMNLSFFSIAMHFSFF